MNHEELRELNRRKQNMDNVKYIKNGKVDRPGPWPPAIESYNPNKEYTKSSKVLDMVDEELKNVSRVKDSRMDTIEKGARIIPHYTHKTIRLGWFRFSFYKLGNKFTLRIELSKGWE